MAKRLLYTISIMINAKEPTYEEKQEKQRGPHGEGGAGQLCCEAGAGSNLQISSVIATCPGPGSKSHLQSDTTPEVEALHPPPGPPPPLYRELQETEVLGPSHWSSSSSHRMTQAPTQSFNGEDIY